MTIDNLDLYSQNEKGENGSPFSVLANELLTNADRTSSKFLNLRYRGVLLVITTANKANAPSIVPKIQTFDVAGNAITLASFSAITTNATTILIYYPAVLTGFSGTEALVGQLPRDWQLFMDYTGTPATDKIDTKVEAMLLI